MSGSKAAGHLLSEVGWNAQWSGDEMRGEGPVLPQLQVPGAGNLRVSLLACWADHLMGMHAVRAMAPRVPATLELDVHLYGPAPSVGTVRGRGRVVKMGRSVVTATAEFSGDDGEVFAETAGSFMVAGDPSVRLPASVLLDPPPRPATIDVPIAERASCTREAPGTALLHRRPDGLNGSNTIHGGLLALVAEEAVLSLAPASSLSSLSLRYLRPVRSGPALARARLRNGLARVEVYDTGHEDRLAVIAAARVFTG